METARLLTKELYGLSRKGEFSRDFGLRDQIRRAAVSVMANIAEGFERGGDKEFQQFLSTAKASCAEVRSHLYVAFDQGDLTDAEFKTHARETEEIGRMIGSFILYLQKSEYRGTKFKRPTKPKLTRDFGLETRDQIQ